MVSINEDMGIVVRIYSVVAVEQFSLKLPGVDSYSWFFESSNNRRFLAHFLSNLLDLYVAGGIPNRPIYPLTTFTYCAQRFVASLINHFWS